MITRISLVDGVVINSVSESAHIQIGDTNEIYAYTNTLAIQQLHANFTNDYDEKFEFPKKDMAFPLFVDEVTKITFHKQPFIKTGPIRSIGVTNSSLIHIGSIGHMYGQANIRHIRQLPNETNREER